MGRKLLVAPVAVNDHATKGYVDDAITARLQPTNPPATLVIGPTNTLQAPGLFLQTDNSGNLLTLIYDDHNGVNGSNNDGLVAAGVTNPLTKPGLWVKKDSSGNFLGIFFYDGNP